jgi:hypothetical protein
MAGSDRAGCLNCLSACLPACLPACRVYS